MTTVRSYRLRLKDGKYVTSSESAPIGALMANIHGLTRVVTREEYLAHTGAQSTEGREGK